MATKKLYPDGSGNLRKYMQGKHAPTRAECIKIERKGGETFVFHLDKVDKVTIEGADFYEMLMKMADQLHEHEKRLQHHGNLLGGMTSRKAGGT